MARWDHRIKLKHLMTDDDSPAGVRRDMAAIADAIDQVAYFRGFDTRPFRNIPEGDDVFGPLDYANKLLDGMYNFADYHRIWIA